MRDLLTSSDYWAGTRIMLGGMDPSWFIGHVKGVLIFTVMAEKMSWDQLVTIERSYRKTY